jgi:amino-acid N-acetyltransferase
MHSRAQRQESFEEVGQGSLRLTAVTVVISSRPPREVAAWLLDAAALPTADLTDAHMEHFYYCGPPSHPIGLIGFEPCGADALLRSLVVSPEHRSSGIGAALLAHAEREARAQGATAMYLLTTTAEAFFLRHEYVASPRELAPERIRATKEFSGICPASSAFLMKRLTGNAS